MSISYRTPTDQVWWGVFGLMPDVPPFCFPASGQIAGNTKTYNLGLQESTMLPPNQIQDLMSVDGEKPVLHYKHKVEGHISERCYASQTGAKLAKWGDSGEEAYRIGDFWILSDISGKVQRQQLTSQIYRDYVTVGFASEDFISITRTQFDEKGKQGIQYRFQLVNDGKDTPHFSGTKTRRYSDGTEATSNITCGVTEVGSFRTGFEFSEVLALIGSLDLLVSIDLMKLKLYSIMLTTSASPLCLDAISSLEPNGSLNVFENSRDALSPLDGLPPFAEFIAFAKHPNPRSLLKLMGEGYIWYRYVYRTTVKDLKDYTAILKNRIKSIDTSVRVFRRREDGEKFGCSYWTTCGIKLEPQASEGLPALIRQLDSLGALPTLARAWDLVPYSFMIDWIINVGDILSSIDVSLNPSKYNVLSCTTGFKAVAPSDWASHLSNDIVTVTSATMSLYERQVGTEIPLDVNVNLSGIGSGGHAIVGASIICTKL